jgi:hypothetical protein
VAVLFPRLSGGRRVPALFFVFYLSLSLSVSLFFSLKNSNSIRFGKTQTFFCFGSRSRRANPIWLRGRARARAEEDACQDTHRASSTHAHTSRARITFRCSSLGRSLFTLFLSLFSSLLLRVCFKRYSGNKHIDPSSSLSLEYARDEKTEKKKARR